MRPGIPGTQMTYSLSCTSRVRTILLSVALSCDLKNERPGTPLGAEGHGGADRYTV